MSDTPAPRGEEQIVPLREYFPTLDAAEAAESAKVVRTPSGEDFAQPLPTVAVQAIAAAAKPPLFDVVEEDGFHTMSKAVVLATLSWMYEQPDANWTSGKIRRLMESIETDQP